MTMQHLLQTNQPPFSDWAAQVERIILRRTGQPVQFDRSSIILRGFFDCGLSPVEIAEDYIEGNSR
jgi:hypothetical protein